MAINEDVYKRKYQYRSSASIWGTDAKYLFTTTDTLKNIISNNSGWQENKVWDNTNVYSTFYPEKYGYDMFGSAHSDIEVSYNEAVNSPPSQLTITKSTSNKINLRYVFVESSTVNMGGGNGFLWKGIDEYSDKMTIQSLFNGSTYKYDDPNWNGVGSKSTTHALTLSEGSSPLNVSNFRFVTDIDRNNCFFRVTLTFGYFDESQNKIINVGVTTNDINTLYQSSNSPYVEQDGKKLFVTNITVTMLARNRDGDKFSKMTAVSRQDVDTQAITDAWNNANATATFDLYVLCEKVVNDKCYYFSIPITTGDNRNFELVYNRGQYINGDETYYYSMLSPWSMSGTMSVINGFEKNDGFNSITCFYSLENTIIEIKDLQRSKQYVYNDSCFFQTVNTGGGQEADYITNLKPIISVNQIFRLFACTLIPFTICGNMDVVPDEISETNKNLYVGTRGEKGIVEGDYSEYIFGETVLDEELRPDDFEPYDPYEEPELPVTPNDFGDIEMGWIPNGITTAFTKYYIMKSYEVDSIGKNLWGKMLSYTPPSGSGVPTPGNMIGNFFLNFVYNKLEEAASYDFNLTLSDVIDYFVSLRYYPIPKLTLYYGAMVDQDHITVGTGVTPISAGYSDQVTPHVYIPPSQLIKIYGGRVNSTELRVNGKMYNSFLDYEPNVSVNLYVPYCGTVSLQPSIIFDPTMSYLELTYCVDIATGSMTAILYKNGSAYFPVATLQGTVGFELLISGNNFNTQMVNTLAAMNRATLSNINTVVGGVMSIASNAVKGDVMGIGNSIAKTGLSAFNNVSDFAIGYPQMVGTSPITVGQSASLAGCIQPSNAFIQIVKHSADIPSNYGNVYGYNSNTVSPIKNQTGYFICANPRLDGIPCNETERNEIYNLLTSGVYRV